MQKIIVREWSMEVRGQLQFGRLDASEANAASRVGSRHDRGKPSYRLAGACDHDLFARLSLFQQGRKLALGLVYVYKHDIAPQLVGQIITILTNSANPILGTNRRMTKLPGREVRESALVSGSLQDLSGA
jgi:hypothetical protein